MTKGLLALGFALALVLGVQSSDIPHLRKQGRRHS